MCRLRLGEFLCLQERYAKLQTPAFRVRDSRGRTGVTDNMNPEGMGVSVALQGGQVKFRSFHRGADSRTGRVWLVVRSPNSSLAKHSKTQTLPRVRWVVVAAGKRVAYKYFLIA